MVSFACPQAHCSDSAAPIRCKYPLSRAILVRNCASILASFRLKVSYRARVCLPGSAVSISLVYFPTSSGSAFCSRCFAFAMFIVVDLTRYSRSCGEHPDLVACCAALLAFLLNSNSPRAGTHIIRTRLPPSLNARNSL